jgi:hypothetical protein
LKIVHLQPVAHGNADDAPEWRCGDVTLR